MQTQQDSTGIVNPALAAAAAAVETPAAVESVQETTAVIPAVIVDATPTPEVAVQEPAPATEVVEATAEAVAASDSDVVETTIAEDVDLPAGHNSFGALQFALQCARESRQRMEALEVDTRSGEQKKADDEAKAKADAEKAAAANADNAKPAEAAA